MQLTLYEVLIKRDPEVDMKMINILKKTNYNKYKMLGHPGKIYYLSHPKSEKDEYQLNKTPKDFFSKILLLRHGFIVHHYMQSYKEVLENVILKRQDLEKFTTKSWSEFLELPELPEMPDAPSLRRLSSSSATNK